MATEQQLIEALKKADAAGDEYAAKRFAAMIKELRASKQVEQGEPQQEVEQPVVKQPKRQAPLAMQEDSILGKAANYIREPLGAIAGAMGGMAAGGLEMLGRSAVGQDLEQVVSGGESTQQALSKFTAPRSKQGQASMGVIAKGAEYLPEVAKPLGDFAFEKTGSPFLATLAYSSPEIAGALTGFIARTPKYIETVQNISTKKAAEKAELIQRIESGDMSAPVAKYRIGKIDEWEKPNPVQIDMIRDRHSYDPRFIEDLSNGVLKLEKIKSADDAIKQLWTEDLLGLVNSSSRADKAIMDRMLSIYEKGAKNMEFRATTRPLFEAGGALNRRIKFLDGLRQQSGKAVGIEARKLKGQKVDFGDIVDDFVSKLENDGVVFNGGRPPSTPDEFLKMDFRRSQLDASDTAQKLITKTLSKMVQKDYAIDGFDLHNLKKTIDNYVFVGNKSDGGLIPYAESLLTDMRKNINTRLGEASPKYAEANKVFSDAITALDPVLRNLPRHARKGFSKIDDKDIALQLRKLLSNYGNATDLAETVKNLDKVSIKYGGNFNDDAVKQALFAIGLDKRLGAFADTSLQGVSEAAGSNVIRNIPTSTLDATEKTLGAIIKRVKRVDNDKAISAMRNYLNEVR